jgi:WD40 repeat protein
MFSADGSISLYDIMKGKLRHQSEVNEKISPEILCFEVMKVSTFFLPVDRFILTNQLNTATPQVVCGTTAGPLLFFPWGEWHSAKSSFKGHSESVDCMLSISDDILVTGSSDGFIR